MNGLVSNPAQELVSNPAQELVARSVNDDDRVLVTGASGWFGRTALDLLHPLGLPVLAIASRTRTISLSGRLVGVRTWDDEEVARFRPTVVIDCAFLTRDRTSDVPLADYVAANRLLTDRMVAAVSRPDVRIALTVSSGAAVYPVDALSHTLEQNPYGYLKREAEARIAEAMAERPGSAIIARAWSVSGAHVQKPRNYALGSMILAAREGSIHVSARRPVFRRYVLAEELLALGLAEGAIGDAVIDSGGELVEMGELAARVVATVAPGATITRDPVDPRDPDAYHSDGVQWTELTHRWSLIGATLDEQIALTARGVLG